MVASYCSTIAGPSRTMPGAQARRGRRPGVATHAPSPDLRCVAGPAAAASGGLRAAAARLLDRGRPRCRRAGSRAPRRRAGRSRRAARARAGSASPRPLERSSLRRGRPRSRSALVALAVVAHVGGVAHLAVAPPRRPRRPASRAASAPSASSRRRTSPGSRSATGRMKVWLNSLRTSATRKPSADSTPGLAAARSPGSSRAGAASALACSGAGAAEGDEREVARVDAALHGDDAQRAEHVLVDDVDDALRGRLGTPRPSCSATRRDRLRAPRRRRASWRRRAAAAAGGRARRWRR